MNKIKRGAALWAMVGGLLLAWFGISETFNAVSEARVQDDITQQEDLAHFYRVIAGEVSGQESGPANKLARDLRDLPAEDLGNFVGDSNRYGGISEDLGFDPFNGVGCSECGPLDDEVIENVEAVKDGDLDMVLLDLNEEVDQPSQIAEPPDLLWILWILSLPVSIGTIYVMQRRSEESRYADFAAERRLLEKLREVKAELPPGSKDRSAVDDLSTRITDQIETRVSYRKSKAQEMKLERLMQEANDCLEAIAAGNKELE